MELDRATGPRAACTGVALAAELGPDLQRLAQLALATLWLLDAVLQAEPSMFTGGAGGFSSMLAAGAAGNPTPVAWSISWAAGVVAHWPVLSNSAFVLVQLVIALGLTRRRTLRPALLLSVAWSLVVWWFGEGLGGVLVGAASPLGGGPGSVLFYALAAVLLWPCPGADAPFVAARALGVRAARGVWLGTWLVLAVLSAAGAARYPGLLRGLVQGVEPGEPGWLLAIDHLSTAVLQQEGTWVTVGLALLCLLVGASVYAGPLPTKLGTAAAALAFLIIWVFVQDLGGILAGGATDPNSGPLVVLLALLYWPLRETDGARHRAPVVPG